MDSILIAILERSVAKNGKDTPLTIGHLLNIVKMASRYREKKNTTLDDLDHSFDFESETYGDRD